MLLNLQCTPSKGRFTAIATPLIALEMQDALAQRSVARTSSRSILLRSSRPSAPLLPFLVLLK